MENLKFKSMNLLDETQRAISDMGFEKATPIQSLAIFPLLEGKDVIGQAQTGTGKTLAYAVPAVETLEEKNPNPQVLILCPTRELAIQVSNILKILLKYRRKASAVAIYGGQRIDLQIRAIRKGAQVIVGTPGRIMDHMRRKTLKFDNVKMVIVDEADEMLNMGFIDDIKTILGEVPIERQIALFSATMPKAILGLSKKFQKNRKFLKVSHEKLMVENVEQLYFIIRESDKTILLSRLLSMYNPESSIVFCNTKKKVDELISALKSLGYQADAIHGDIRQASRDRVMESFRSRNTKILVATDVAARGIDVKNVEIIFNYDLPQYHEYYIHRVGRTGRMGKSGKAFTFVTGREVNKLKNIQRYAKADVKLAKIPSVRDVERNKANILVEQVKRIAEEKSLDRYAEIIRNLDRENYPSVNVAAALLKIVLNSSKTAHPFIEKTIDEDFRGSKYRFKKNTQGKKKGRNFRIVHQGSKSGR